MAEVHLLSDTFCRWLWITGGTDKNIAVSAQNITKTMWLKIKCWVTAAELPHAVWPTCHWRNPHWFSPPCRTFFMVMFHDHVWSPERRKRSQTVVKAIYLPFKKGGEPLKCEFAVGYAPLWIHVSPSILVEPIIVTSGFLKFGCYSYPKTIGFPLGVFQIHKPRSSYKLLVYIHPVNCKCMESKWRFPKMGVPPNYPVYRCL